MLRRFQHLTSGVSPALPLYLLLAAYLWWCLVSVQGQALLDFRRPKLPSFDVNARLACTPALRMGTKLTADGNKNLVDVLLSPFGGITSGDLWVTARVALPCAFFLLLSFLFLLDGRHPIYSLQGEFFDRFYGWMALAALCLLFTNGAKNSIRPRKRLYR